MWLKGRELMRLKSKMTDSKGATGSNGGPSLANMMALIQVMREEQRKVQDDMRHELSRTLQVAKS